MNTTNMTATGREPMAPVVRFLRDHLVAPLVRWHKRNRLYREMVTLDDRVLDDLGITRYEIPDVVAGAYRDEPANVAVLKPKAHARRPARDDHDRPLAA